MKKLMLFCSLLCFCISIVQAQTVRRRTYIETIEDQRTAQTRPQNQPTDTTGTSTNQVIFQTVNGPSKNEVSIQPAAESKKDETLPAQPITKAEPKEKPVIKESAKKQEKTKTSEKQEKTSAFQKIAEKDQKNKDIPQPTVTRKEEEVVVSEQKTEKQDKKHTTQQTTKIEPEKEPVSQPITTHTEETIVLEQKAKKQDKEHTTQQTTKVEPKEEPVVKEPTKKQPKQNKQEKITKTEPQKETLSPSVVVHKEESTLITEQKTEEIQEAVQIKAPLFTGNTGKWTLRECIGYATENNIELKQQILNVKGAEVDLSTSKNSRLPDLNASVGQSFNFGRSANMATGMYEDNKAASTSLHVSSSTPLFTGFRISNQIKADELNLYAATEGLKKAKENIELQVASLYLDVLFKKEILKANQEQVGYSNLQVERTKILFESGKIPASQLYDIKAQLAKDELNVTMANNDLSLSLLTLSQSLNLPVYEGFDIEEPNLGDVIYNNISSVLPPDQVYNMALGIKPQIKEAEYTLKSNEKLLKVAQAGHWPTLSLGLSYDNGFSHVYKDGYENPSISNQIKNNQREVIGLTLSIPIFNRFQVRNQVRKARLNIENQNLVLDNVKLALYKEIQQAYQSAVAAQSKFSSTNKACDSAEESFKYAQERYDIGKSTVFEFNEAKTKVFTSKSEQIQAKYDFLFRSKILDFYQGKPINIE